MSTSSLPPAPTVTAENGRAKDHAIFTNTLMKFVPELAPVIRPAPAAKSPEGKAATGVAKKLHDATEHISFYRGKRGLEIAQEAMASLYDHRQHKHRRNLAHEPNHNEDPVTFARAVIKQVTIALHVNGADGTLPDVARLQQAAAELAAYCERHPPVRDVRLNVVHELNDFVKAALAFLV